MAKQKPQRINHIGNAINEIKEEVNAINQETSTIEMIPINAIHDLLLEDNSFMHNRITYDNSKIKELANSISNIAEQGEGIMGTGLLNPIMLRKNNGRLERISGENRIRAFTLLGKTEIPAIVKNNVSDNAARYMRTSENINRDDLNPYDETLSILEYVQLECGFSTQDATKSFINKVKNHLSNKVNLNESEIAKYKEMHDVFNKVGRYDIASFANRLVLLNVNDLVKQALRDGYLGYTQAIIINSKLKIEKDIEKILALLKQKQMTKVELKEYIVRILKSYEDSSITESNFLEKSINASKVLNIIKYKKLNDSHKNIIDQKLIQIMEIYKEIERVIN